MTGIQFHQLLKEKEFKFTRRKGLEGLGKSLEVDRLPRLRTMYGPELEEGIAEIEKMLPDRQKGRRALALMLLAGDESLREWLHARLSEQAVQKIEEISQHLEWQAHSSRSLPRPI